MAGYASPGARYRYAEHLTIEVPLEPEVAGAPRPTAPELRLEIEVRLGDRIFAAYRRVAVAELEAYRLAEPLEAQWQFARLTLLDALALEFGD